ncbi:MAG: PAS domain S-box protein [Crocinitomicaceae bacterium]|nr:PAS domain S-box protein [Crocinitomicaceae bacterium]
MTKKLLLLLCLLLNVGLWSQIRQFEHFGRREGLGMSSIHCARQSSDGHLWIGLDGAGLSKFDGENFTEITPINGPRTLHVTDILFSEDNVLFASRFNGFFSYSQKNNSIQRIDDNDFGRKFGDRKRLLQEGKSLYLFYQRQIIWKSNGVFKPITHRDLPKENINVIDHILLDQGILFSTETGWFHVLEGKITPICEWIGKTNLDVSNYRFGYKKDNIVTLCSPYADNWIQIKLNKESIPTLTRGMHVSTPFNSGEQISKCTYNEKRKDVVLITNTGRLFSVHSGTLKLIPHNMEYPFSDIDDLFIDFNGSIWLSSTHSGLHKVSTEPFVQFKMNPIMRVENISLTHKIDELLVLDFFGGNTHIGNPLIPDEFKSFDFHTYSIDKGKKEYYFATNNGIKTLDREAPGKISFNTFLLPNEKISIAIEENGYLWYSPFGEGLYRYDLKTKKTQSIQTDQKRTLEFVYTAQKSKDGKFLYFGGNNGVYKVNIESGLASPIMGSQTQYAGNSATDSYGNCWFTCGENLLGILNNGTTRIISDQKYFNSPLFYTLESDSFGNLILGTNKGISIINIGEFGNILSSNHYDSSTGFEGYETHTRSNFKDNSIIYVGTIEGLFIIDTKELESTSPPNQPYIYNLLEKANAQERNSTAHFKITVLNPRTKSLQYRYRLVELNETWEENHGSQEITFDKLKSGRFTLEAQASYDGAHWSESSFQHFDINVSIWKSSWFIVVLIGGIIALNLFLLSFNKNTRTINLLGEESKQIYLEMAPAMLIFAAFYVTSSHLIAPIVTSELTGSTTITLIEGVILIALYLTSLVFKRQNKKHLYLHLLIIAIGIITLHFFWELYISNLYPYHILGIVLTGTVAPYVFTRLSHSTIYSFITILITIIIVFNVDNPAYPKPYTIIGIFVNASLIIFNSHLRYSSLEKLTFISGIINQGNIPVISYDSKGTISFATENISNFVNLTHEELINNNISALNKFVLYDDSYRDVDVTQDFLSDGGKYLVPMTGDDQSIRWIEWSYKQFSKNLRVIIGSDVSEKVEIENTHELLVQKVEDFISTVDVNGNITFLNDSLLDKMGYQKEDLIGRNAVELVAPEYRKNAEKFYSKHFKERKLTSYYEIPILKKNGDVVWVGQHVNTIYAPGSKKYINGYIALARDITERRKQERLIREQRDNITSSINYALRIQRSLLPKERKFEIAFNDYFIFYRPKDIVSGDFYWIQSIGNKQVIVLGDCTGHGVPGSLMTVLGINLLNNIVLEARITEPSAILNELDKRIIEYLQKHNNEEKIIDGIEITIIVIEEGVEEMSYACAGSRFLIYQKNTFAMFKGNNEHIGDIKGEEFVGYQTQYTALRPNDILYLFSDGFQDQFGGVKNKKYSFRRMLELLESNVNLELAEQQNMIEKEFDSWKDSEEQTDDVTILAIKRGIPLEEKTNESL